MHHHASIRGHPNTITDELSRQWNLDMANRLRNLMRIDPIEGRDGATEPFDADNYLAWLYQYAQLKLELGIAVKHLRGNDKNILVDDRARAFSECTPREDPIQKRIAEAEKRASSSDKKRAASPPKGKRSASSAKKRDTKFSSRNPDNQWGTPGGSNLPDWGADTSRGYPTRDILEKWLGR